MKRQTINQYSMKSYRLRTVILWTLILFIGLCITGCSHKQPLHITIPHVPPAIIPPQPTLTAGAWAIDITPPPGMPMAGYSMFSCKGKGVRNKLMARAIYLKPAQGKPVVLVQADLLYGSDIVHHRVAELIAKETDVDAGGLLFCGSHTHSGPGNIFGCDVYNAFASNKKGFEKDYYEFLSSRVAEAVIVAFNKRKPAKIANSTIEVPKGITANRSLKAYLRNDIKNKDTMDRFSAVNPKLHLIRIDCLDTDGKYKPAAVFSNYSIHNNTNPAKLHQLYHGDAGAYIARSLEREIERIYAPSWDVVHAVANHTQGDNNPYYGEAITDNFRDFRRVGCFIASVALERFRELDDQLTNDVIIRYRTVEKVLFTDNTIAGVRVAKKPKFGCSKLGGAAGQGRSTFLKYIPFLAPGWPRIIFTKGAQGHKRVFLGPFQYCVVPGKGFPHHLFLQVIQIHDTVLMAVPNEITFQLGKEISDYAAQKGKESGLTEVKRYVVVSCANGFMDYVTTKKEYEIQYYEGGSNLYGPNTGKFLELSLGQLVEQMAKEGTGTSIPHKWEFSLIPGEYYPKALAPKGTRDDFDGPFFHKGGVRDEPFWSFKWMDVPPALIDFHKPLVFIEVSNDNNKWETMLMNGKPLNDTNTDIFIRFLDKITKKNMGIYETRWYNPKMEKGKFYRFAFHTRSNLGRFESESFTLQ